MKTKTVVIVSEFAYVEGGATKVAIQTALALAEKDLDVIFFTAVGPIDEQLKASNVQIECLNQKDILHNENRFEAMKQGIYNSYAKKRFEELLKKLDPISTIVHFHTWTKALSSSVFVAAEKLGFHIVLTIHDYFLACPNGGLYDYRKHRICEKRPLSYKCVLCNCDSRHYSHKVWRIVRQMIQNRNIRKNNQIGYIFISDLSKSELIKNVDFYENQFFLRNPIDFEKNIETQAQNNIEFAFVGRLSEEKGISLFCQAITECGVRGIVIGDGPLKETLQNKYSGQVTFTGWADHSKIRQYLNTARCLVFPSRWLEVSPLTPLEAQAMGIPCIVPDRCGASESIHNHENGLIFKSGDIDDLKEKINMMKDNILVKKLAKGAYESFNEKEYSQNTYSKNLLIIYEKMLISSAKNKSILAGKAVEK